jgi:hypothetical protein
MKRSIPVVRTSPRIIRKGMLLAFCVGGLALMLSAPGNADDDNKLITFDVPGAGTVANDFNGTFATAINALGTVAGYYNDSNLVSHCFIRTTHGKITTFDVPGADVNPADAAGSIISAINAFGTTVGNYLDSSFVSHGFLRSPDGKFTTFDVPGAGGFGTTPLAINEEGAIVGYYTDSNYSFHAFLRSPDGAFTTWIGPDACTGNGSDGCYGSGASNMNGFGIVVGGYEDNLGNFVHHSYIRTPNGSLKKFDVPGAGTAGYQGTGCPGCSLGFNQWGATAGTYIDSNSVQHGFLRSAGGTFTTFDALGAGTGSYQGTGCPSDCPTSLNDWGAILGTYIDANYTYHGYLRTSDGKIVTVDPTGSVFTWSTGLNDLGMITGYYADTNGVYHGFLRTQDR